MKLTCAVIDDEPLAAGLLESYVAKTPFLELRGVYNSALQALPVLSADPVDLLFLDIQMPGVDGLEFSNVLRGDTRIVFTTAFQQYALDGYRVNALDYLLKPIAYNDFLGAANKALQWFALSRSEKRAERESSEAGTLFVKTGGKLVRVALGDILYVEGLKDYVKIFLEGAASPLLSLSTLKAMESVLPPDRFMRVHRSFIVQLAKIRQVERNRIVFGKVYIPVSDHCREPFAAYLERHALPQ